MVNNKKTIEIPLSKTKITVLLILGAVFLAVALWLIVSPESFYNPDVIGRRFRALSKSISGIRALGIVVFLFSCTCFVYALWKFFDRKPGLIIDDLSITDNSSAVAAGTIFWRDIMGISQSELGGKSAGNVKFICVQVKNPRDYINRQTNILKRQLMKDHLKMMGTPITINTNTLLISHVELLQLLNQKYAEYLDSRRTGTSDNRAPYRGIKW